MQIPAKTKFRITTQPDGVATQISTIQLTVRCLTFLSEVHVAISTELLCLLIAQYSCCVIVSSTTKT